MTDPDSRSYSTGTVTATPTGAAANSLDIDIVIEAGDWSGFAPVDAAVLEAAREVVAEPTLDIGCATVSFALGDDARIRELNSRFRGKDKPTNVLSFPPLAQLTPGTDHLGDIILAAETVLAEATDQGVPPRHHLQHLVVHGLLHLLGFDHETAEEADEMEALETVILARLGIANPYADPPADGPAEIRVAE